MLPLAPPWRVRITLALVMLAVLVVYVFYASAGRWSNWPPYWGYYDHLAEAFRNGQLHLLLAPQPLLLEQADPFDPRHARLWAWDFSLYRGKYYLYWGPVPALFQAGAKIVLGIRERLGDQYLVFAFSCLCLAFGTLLVDSIARRLFPRVPRYLVVGAMLVLAFANPMPHMLASGGHYQAAIMGAQAFLLGGLVAAFDAVWLGAWGGDGRRRLLLAGAAWALALGCRISILPAVALLAAATLVAVVGADKGGLRTALPLSLRLVLPLVIAVLGLLLYNRLRFDAWLDFGVGHQLSTMKFRTSLGFVPLNLYSYLFRAPELSCAFPFVLQERNVGASGFPSWFELERSYSTTEPLVGMLVVVPWAWLAPLGMIAYPFGCWRRALESRVAQSHAGARAGLWCAASFATLGLVTTLPTLALFIATMRYLGDASYGILLCGVLGAFYLYERAREKPMLRRLVTAMSCALGAVTIVFGLLLGIQGYDNHFAVHNPALYSELVRALSMCRP